jgi:23S rRNA (guanosine2251-2'-O)-methyltransferase
LGRERRRSRLHNELAKLGIDPNELETQPESFGTAAIRTFNSFLLPKSPGALAVAESPTRAKVVANSISFLLREHKADQERWIQNVDKNRARDDGVSGAAERITSSQPHVKHPITLILDNVRSAHNVGNILRLAEASQVDSVRLCGMTPRPPHPKVLKTAMGAAELVSLGDSEASLSTLQTVLELKSEGVTIIGVETTENSTTLWDANIPAIDDSPVAYIFGNELIGVGECLF